MFALAGPRHIAMCFVQGFCRQAGWSETALRDDLSSYMYMYSLYCISVTDYRCFSFSIFGIFQTNDSLRIRQFFALQKKNTHRGIRKYLSRMSMLYFSI